VQHIGATVKNLKKSARRSLQNEASKKFVILQTSYCCLQSSSKKVIGREEWEKKLGEVKIRKEDMNKLVMNYLVTEGYVDAAEKFQLEAGVKREQQPSLP
jgi:predicted class III extradiol MEMO1 family dioxygenase